MSAGASGDAARGELAIVLHTHMPYVEGYGTWPFGEEWLWEAMATSYLPLLDVLERGAPLTLSLTPVLGDQLEAEGAGERFLAFLRGTRAETHRRDAAGLRASGEDGLAREVERAGGDYVRAAERFERLGGDLLTPLTRHASWTSAATHAVLPLLATDAGVRLQVETGIDAHRRRAAAAGAPPWGGGLWLPECAYAPWLDALLEAAGVRATCVDLTDVLGGPGAGAHLRPLATDAGPLLAPLDRETVELVWSEGGYPAAAAYRDRHRLTLHHHRPWANDGSWYDRERALAQARTHAADFVARTLARLDRARADLRGPGLVVFAIDTELLGDWWYEGIAWLDAVLDEAARQGLALARLDDALEGREPAPAPALAAPVSWGTPRDLSTWDSPAVADLLWRARDAELRVLAAGPDAGLGAVRELLALQASDWAFLLGREAAGPYPRERADGHAHELERRLAGLDSRAPRVRNLAPHASLAPLLQP